MCLVNLAFDDVMIKAFVEFPWKSSLKDDHQSADVVKFKLSVDTREAKYQ